MGLRWSELQALRWRDVSLTEGRLRVEESKTPTGERSLSIPAPLLDDFKRHFQRTHYKDEGDFVFCHPERGSKWHSTCYRLPVNEAVKRAGIEGKFRPAHDLR
jgi:integrase